MNYSFKRLKEQYNDFVLPMANVIVEGKSLGASKAGLVIGNIEVELTSGHEASSAAFYIYNCIEAKTGEYKFDDLKPFILLGSALVIELGYSTGMKEVFRGFIAQVQVMCEEEESPCVEVSAMDVKGIMMANVYTRQMQADCYSAAVKEIFEKPVYQRMKAKEIIKDIKISETPDKNNGMPLEMVSESDYEFIVKAAKKFNFEFYTDLGTVYFRKAKKERTPIMTLGLAEGILNYQVSYDISGLVQQIEARSMDDGKGELISEKKKFKNKISFGSKASPLLDKTERVYIDPTIRSKEQAAYRVESLMENMSYQFGSLDYEAIGLPELKPGFFLDIGGFGKLADNQFYITSIRHKLAAPDGYKTTIIGKAASIEKG